MRLSRKRILILVSIVLLIELATAFLQMRAFDFWSSGKLGLNDGNPKSPIFFVQVYGVGSTPTIARFVRLEDHTAVPHNYLDVTRSTQPEARSHVQNVDRWNRTFLLIAGRTPSEEIPIRLDAAAAERLFSRPVVRSLEYADCSDVWDNVISAHMPPQPRH
jgi:hypothetical protein